MPADVPFRRDLQGADGVGASVATTGLLDDAASRRLTLIVYGLPETAYSTAPSTLCTPTSGCCRPADRRLPDKGAEVKTA